MLHPTRCRLFSLPQGLRSRFEPYTIKSLFIYGFLGSMLYMSSSVMRELTRVGPLASSDADAVQRRLQSDPHRPPWPLLHQRVVLLREGKGTPEDLALLWSQTRHYYPADWLIPLELAQVLKYSSATYLQNYVANPDALRKEVLTQLLDVRYGRVSDPNGGRLNRDIEEIITSAIDDLESLSLDVTAGGGGTSTVPLVPTHT